MRILVPVDGSSYSMEGVNVALDYAKMKDAEVYLLTVIPSVLDLTHGLMPSQGDVIKSTLTKNAEEVVVKAKAIFTENGIIPRVKIADTVNTVADEIYDFVENESIDVVIIGSRGLKGSSRFLLGSVASKVVRYCPCSVFVVRMP